MQIQSGSFQISTGDNKYTDKTINYAPAMPANTQVILSLTQVGQVPSGINGAIRVKVEVVNPLTTGFVLRATAWDGSSNADLEGYWLAIAP